MFNFFNILYTISYPVNYFLQFLGRLISYIPGAKNLGNLSRAAKTAWMVWIPVLIFVTVMLIIDWSRGLITSPATSKDELFGQPWNLILTIVLVFALPFAVYWMVRLVDTDKIRILPVIDDPWEQGLEELAALGIDPKLTPFFLVLGTDAYQKSNDFHGKSFFKLEIKGTPGGESYALHWYAGTEAIFLHLNGACRASHAVKKYRGGGMAPTGKSGSSRMLPAYDQTIDSGDSFDADYMSTDSSPSYHPDRTEVFDPESSDSFSGVGYAGTLTGDEDFDEMDSGSIRSSGELQTESVDINESVLSERLVYLSSLIKRFRGDEVPIDGVIAYAPCESVEANANQVATCFNDDLTQLRDELGSNFPVTVIVSDMHDADGFASLVKELGSKRAQMSRFGKGFEVENVPSSEEMDLLSVAACESFQQHIYKAYSKRNLSSLHENKKLFSLLSRVNTKLRSSLKVFLHRICLAPDHVDPNDFHAMTGCYFAATGSKDSELAFVNGILKKAIENCESTKWTNESIYSDRLYKGLAGLFSLLALICFALSIYFIFQPIGGE